MTLGFVSGKDSNIKPRTPKPDSVNITIASAPVVQSRAYSTFSCDFGTIAYVALGCTILIGLAIILPIGLTTTEAASGV